MPPENNQTQIENLATLLVLDEEIRKLNSIREFGFFSTNETHRLLPYHTGYLWQLKEFIGPLLVSQSGTAEIDIHAPINQWLITKLNLLRSSPVANRIHQLDLNIKENPESTETKLPAQIELPSALPPYLLWCPLLNKANKITGGLMFFRETPYTEAEIKMVSWLLASYQYTWRILLKPIKLPPWEKLKERPYLIALSIIILGILLFPIRLSVLGDATVVPKDPVLINAPMQGVIKSFAVSPGQSVVAGQLLLTLDKTDLKAAVDVSRKDYLLTETKLRGAINGGFDNKDSRADIPILQAQLTIDKAHYDYTQELLNKADITTPSGGIVIFESKEDWVGQPLKTGERILVVANPYKVQLKVTVPIESMIELSIGDKGEFFLYGQLNSLSCHLVSLGYNAKLMPNRVLAYQLKADFNDDSHTPQLGTQGTVKIYGHYVPLIYYLLRRPLQASRQTLGL